MCVMYPPYIPLCLLRVQVALSNLDAVLMEARGLLGQLPMHLLQEMECVYKGLSLAASQQGHPCSHMLIRPSAAPASLGEHPPHLMHRKSAACNHLYATSSYFVGVDS